MGFQNTFFQPPGELTLVRTRNAVLREHNSLKAINAAIEQDVEAKTFLFELYGLPKPDPQLSGKQYFYLPSLMSLTIEKISKSTTHLADYVALVKQYSADNSLFLSIERISKELSERCELYLNQAIENTYDPRKTSRTKDIIAELLRSLSSKLSKIGGLSTKDAVIDRHLQALHGELKSYFTEAKDLLFKFNNLHYDYLTDGNSRVILEKENPVGDILPAKKELPLIPEPKPAPSPAPDIRMTKR